MTIGAAAALWLLLAHVEAPEDGSKARSAQSADSLLDSARRAEQELRYELALELAQEARAAPDITESIRVQCLLLEGVVLVVMGRDLDAELVFSSALEISEDMELPETAPPKAVAVFRMVQSEVREASAARRTLERRALIETLRIVGGVDELRGGFPAVFRFELRDPTNAVARVRLNYRREGEPSYSALALQNDAGNEWTGKLPGEWTSSPVGYALEYFVETLDLSNKPLLLEGSPAHPIRVPVRAGLFRKPKPFYRKTWFWGAVGTAAIVSTIAGIIAAREATELPKSDVTPLMVP